MTGNFFLVLTTMLLLATNSHYYIIAALVKSYNYFPINPLAVHYSTAFFVEITSKVIALSLQIAMPVFGAMLLADIGVGLLSKTVPQLKYVFRLIFPVEDYIWINSCSVNDPFFGDNRVTDVSIRT